MPGWDCHGLPIEIKVDNDLGAKKAQMTAAEIRRACRKYAEKFVDLQRTDFKRLGVFGQWEDPYLTMSAQYQSVIAGAFVEFLGPGIRLQGPEAGPLVHPCRTALAEAEVEYENHTSPSIWVRFALTSDPARIHPALAGRKVYGLIWTTTPWTMPANLAIAFHPKFVYAAVDVAGRCLHRRRGSAESDRRKMRMERSAGGGQHSRVRRWKARCSGIRSWSAIPLAFWRIT